MVYAIHEHFFPDVEKKLKRVARKCEKYGNGFTFEVKGEEIQERTCENGMKEYNKFILIDVEGTAKIDDWECIAVLEINSAGNIVRKINTEIDIPKRFWNSDNICEHCGSKRYRTNLYVIHNTVTDEWKQVGGSCLKLYTGGLNMEYVAAFMDGITELEELVGVVGNGKHYYDVRTILKFATEIISKTGYFSSDSPLPTKNMVAWLMFKDFSRAIEGMNKDLESRNFDVRFSGKDFYRPETEATVDAIIQYYKSLEDDGEFIHNVQVMLESGYVSSKSFGFLSYLPEGYAKYVQKEAEKAERAKQRKEEKSEHFGVVGKRYKDVEIKAVNLIASWENQYGYTYVYKIVIADNFVLTWKTSNGLFLENDEEFDKITFSVKTHSEYNGQKQTEVTRCKVSVKKI